MSLHPSTKAATTISRLRLLVLSEVDDWDFGRQVKASGHDIVAWARPIWKRGPKGGGFGYAIRTIVRAMWCRSKPIRAITPRFDAWRWLDKEKIQRITSPNVNSPTFVEYVKCLNIDLIVVFFFPQILKTALLQTPRLGVLNCHPSLLPRYGGPHPAFWMLKNGESVAGVTVHVMTEKIDAGDIIVQQELIVGESENAGQLTQRQHHAAAALLTEAVNAMARGTLNPKPQNIAERTYFGKKKAADTVLDWNGSARQIANLWRAVQPYEPLAACLNGTTIKIYDAQPQEGPPSGRVPGEIMAKRSGRLLVQTGNGYLEIRSYEIVPFHGWINRILQGFMLSVGSRFDLAPSPIGLTSKAAS
ncbi:MAG TPA: methionyl-tRNA formyltransferase [Nitrospiraceae bacterium]|nr:methionyl-tRNA formyltransferase [Nitrospiraceae bacterium]